MYVLKKLPLYWGDSRLSPIGSPNLFWFCWWSWKKQEKKKERMEITKQLGCEKY
jgi:hypothetical protein